jgi:leucine dehydrogenase
MGIVNCANEQYGYIDNDPMILKHFDKNWEHSIYKTAQKVFDEARLNEVPTGKIALATAEKLSLVNHPIFGHRGKMIIESLINSEWDKN